MIRAHHMTDSAIEYAIADINAAIAANPENSRVRQYLDERDPLRAEESGRARKRTLRNMAQFMPRDLLRVPVPTRRYARKHPAPDYWRKSARDAAFSLGWIRRKGGAR